MKKTKYDFPEMPFERIQELAWNILSRFGYVDRVGNVSLPLEIEKLEVDLHLDLDIVSPETAPAKWRSGVPYAQPDTNSVVIQEPYTKNKDEFRSYFAHELGHIVLHKAEMMCQTRMFDEGHTYGASQRLRQRLESQAWQFALAITIPQPAWNALLGELLLLLDLTEQELSVPKLPDRLVSAINARAHVNRLIVEQGVKWYGLPTC